MFLYHYSKDEYPKLKSLNLRKVEDGDKDFPADPMHYGNHISFLFEKIPLNLPSKTNNMFSQWQKGSKLFEHVIDTKDLPVDLIYLITETPEKTKLLYETQDWDKTKDNPALIAKYKEEIAVMEKKLNYSGTGRVDFVLNAKKFNSGILKHYVETMNLAKKYPDDGLLDKYAACVPHAMLYVGQTPIKVTTSKQVVLT